MCLLFETICIQDGIPLNLEYHELRMNRSRHQLFRKTDNIILNDLIRIPENFSKGKVRCRIVYGENPGKPEFSLYEAKPIHSLRIIHHDEIKYSHKFSEREILNCLYQLRENADDILIIKDGRITDTSIANIIFYDGKEWVTPDTPLLEGTQRQKLLDEGRIKAIPVYPGMLSAFQSAMTINAMNPFDPVRKFAALNIR